MYKLFFRRINRKLINLNRHNKQMLMLFVDFVLLVGAVWAAYTLRLGYIYNPNFNQWLLILAAPVFAIPVFLKTGLYRSVIRYLGEQALWSILKGMTLAALLWAFLAFMTQMTGNDGVPRSVPLLYWLIGMILISGVRFFARWVLWVPIRRHFTGRQVLIYGAGGAGRQLAASLRQGSELFPAGFLDDDVKLHGKDIDSLRVYSPNDLAKLIERFEIRDIIVSLPSATSIRRREVVDFLEKYKVRVRILPAMSDIASGKHLVSMVREVNIGDLLGRDLVVADPKLLGKCISNKVVLVTGAGGSIGSELSRQIALVKPAKLLLLDQGEHALYQVDRLVKSVSDCEVVLKLGSVQDENLVTSLLLEHKVQTIYHAAAYKHVPLVEANVIEGTKNNVFGTLAVAKAAITAKVENFVLISSDKAVRPTNVMGATKRWAELIIQEFAYKAKLDVGLPRFCAVRFGNVLGSSGSVIPLFKEQIAKGGPVTVTHEDVTRYFMSIPEAVQLVIQAGSMSEGGEIFLLDMGEPVKIMDLARNMIRLAGYAVCDDNNPNGDIEIIVTGLRPGEKLFEELLIDSKNARDTTHPRIMKGVQAWVEEQGISEWKLSLDDGIKAKDNDMVREILMSRIQRDVFLDI